jgi:hypothetical protein
MENAFRGKVFYARFKPYLALLAVSIFYLEGHRDFGAGFNAFLKPREGLTIKYFSFSKG